MADQSDQYQDYIRGARAAFIDPARVLRTSLAVVVLGAAVLAGTLTFAGVHDNDRITRLKDRGVPVSITVVACIARASGTGITAAGFTCTGSYEYAGAAHVETIGGTSVLFRRGDVVAGVADPRVPGTLATATSVRDTHASWHPFIWPAILGTCALLGVVVLIRGIRRNR